MQSEQAGRLNAALAGRYVIERELGRGGMATVYLADDLKHGRKVAIKVLRPELASTIGPDRFLREIETAARLNHPHILPLYDSGAADAILYFVMPFVRGESLRQKLAREGQLPIEEVVAIAGQVAAALDFAHAQGVIHRDVKPENILLHEGVAMVADFGIALAVHGAGNSRLTDTGLLVGTPEYMSPEQATGEPGLDARSDVYSLGCVVYEMLAGESPFSGPNAQAMIASRLTDPVPPVRRVRSGVSPRMERALVQALATDPADRFPSAAAFVEALKPGDSAGPVDPCVAVLPFLNLSADPENLYFADGITEDVIAQLSRIRSLKVISRTSVMQFRNREQNLREIGAALAATTILEGSVRRVADRVRVVAQLIDVATDRHLWAETYDRRLTDIFVIQTDVALHIAAALRAELTRDETDRIRKEPTSDLDAYQLYLQGRHCGNWSVDGVRESIRYYGKAVDRDPDYAMAHVGLALAYTDLGEIGGLPPDEAYRKGKESAVRALAIDSELGEAHCALAYLMFVSEFDWPGAEREFKRAMELTPGNADTYDLYGRLCSALERYEEAIAMQRRAHELDPMTHRVDLATALLRAGRTDEALQVATRAIELFPEQARGLATVGWALMAKGLKDEGLPHLERAVTLAPGDTLWLAQLGQAYGMTGAIDQARAILQQIEALSQRQYVSPYHLAYVYTGLGERDRAVACLEKAFVERAGAVYGIKGSFLFATLHSHPGFTALLRKMNLA